MSVESAAEPVAQPLVGFRHWGARRGGLYSGIFVAGQFIPNPALRMVAPRVRPMPWPTSEDRVAKCFALRGHDAPHRDCNCGYAAWYELPDDPAVPAPEGAWGAICAWGRIVEHETGFRAQYARAIALLDLRYPGDRREKGLRIENAAEAYGIPVLPREDLVAYARWHGELRAA